MNIVLTLWGYEISSSTLLFAVLAYFAICAAALVLIPKRVVPIPEDLTREEREKSIELRNKVRQTLAQMFAGVAIIATFIATVQQIRQNEDNFNQKKADLFANAVHPLSDLDAKRSDQIKALHVLSYVARADPSYHRAVFDVVASFINDLSTKACEKDKYKEQTFARDPRIQLATRIVGERRAEHDPTGKQLNLEKACLVGIDLRDEWAVVKGLQKARLSDAKMLRVDFTRVELQNAELMGIEAGDCHNEGWSPETGYNLNVKEKDENRVPNHIRRKFVAHFVQANLTNTRLSGAGLEGADFSGADLQGTVFYGANVSRANFRGAQHITEKQFEHACVGRSDLSEEEQKKEQPYFDEGKRIEIKNVCPKKDIKTESVCPLK